MLHPKGRYCALMSFEKETRLWAGAAQRAVGGSCSGCGETGLLYMRALICATDWPACHSWPLVVAAKPPLSCHSVRGGLEKSLHLQKVSLALRQKKKNSLLHTS